MVETSCKSFEARGDVLAWTHSIFKQIQQIYFLCYDKFKEQSKDNNKVFIKGERKNRRPLEVFFTFGMQIISFLFLRIYLSDINAQPKLFSRDFYNKFLVNSYPKDFSLDLFALYHAKVNHYEISTIPVYFKKRIHGVAKGGGGGWKARLNLIFRTLKYIIKLKNTFKHQ